PSRLSPRSRRSKTKTLLPIITGLALIAASLVAKEFKPASAAGKPGKPNPPVTAVGPRQSSPIALTSDNLTLLNVNPEANPVTVFNVSGNTPVKQAELAVGHDPSSVAILPDGSKAYVANSLDGTVSVINLSGPSVSGSFAVGVEPMAVATSPNGS